MHWLLLLCQQTFHNKLLANLAETDLMWGILNPLLTVTVAVKPKPSTEFCCLTVFLVGMLLTLNVIFLSAIVIDRYVAVSKPIEYHKLQVNLENFNVFITTSTIYSIFVGGLFASQIAIYYTAEFSCFDFEPLMHPWFAVFFTGHYFIALIFMVYAYTTMIIAAVRQQKKINDTLLLSQNSTVGLLVQVKAARMSAVIIGSSMVLIAPTMFQTVITSITKQKDQNFIYFLLKGPGFTLNSLLDPIIYFLLVKDFRRCIKKLLCRSNYIAAVDDNQLSQPMTISVAPRTLR